MLGIKSLGSKVSFTAVVITALVVCFGFLNFWATKMPTAVIQIGEKKLYVQVAKTIGQRHTGLGGREQLLPYGGMVFPYSPPKRAGIVMRDMQFPIDIIWARAGTIVDIAPNVQTEPDATEVELTVYYPRTEADLVIEVVAGFTEQYGIQIGDQISVIEE